MEKNKNNPFKMFKLIVATTCLCLGAALADADGPHLPHFRAPFAHVPAPYAPAPAPYAPAPAPYVPAPAPYAPPPPAYAPAPAPYHPAPYVETPRPFTYEYGVNDHYSGASFSKSENQVRPIECQEKSWIPA